jgi:hypothetical protein
MIIFIRLLYIVSVYWEPGLSIVTENQSHPMYRTQQPGACGLVCPRHAPGQTFSAPVKPPVLHTTPRRMHAIISVIFLNKWRK